MWWGKSVVKEQYSSLKQSYCPLPDISVTLNFLEALANYYFPRAGARLCFRRQRTLLPGCDSLWSKVMDMWVQLGQWVEKSQRLGQLAWWPGSVWLNSCRLQSRWLHADCWLRADLEACWLSSHPCRLFGKVLIALCQAVPWPCNGTGNWVPPPEGFICSCGCAHQMW